MRIHYAVEGTGEPVVLIHGWGVDLAWNWAESGIINWEGGGSARRRRLQTAEFLDEGKGIGPAVEALTPPGEKAAVAGQMEAINQWFLDRNDPVALAAIARGNAGLQAPEAKLRASRLPVLAIVGELDPLRPSVDKLAGIMRNLRVVVVPAANHMFAVQRPEFLDALKTFLAAHAGK